MKSLHSVLAHRQISDAFAKSNSGKFAFVFFIAAFLFAALALSSAAEAVTPAEQCNNYAADNRALIERYDSDNDGKINYAEVLIVQDDYFENGVLSKEEYLHLKDFYDLSCTLQPVVRAGQSITLKKSGTPAPYLFNERTYEINVYYGLEDSNFASFKIRCFSTDQTSRVIQIGTSQYICDLASDTNNAVLTIIAATNDDMTFKLETSMPACVPKTSCTPGKSCGTEGDGCGGVVTCGGTCHGPESCDEYLLQKGFDLTHNVTYDQYHQAIDDYNAGIIDSDCLTKIGDVYYNPYLAACNAYKQQNGIGEYPTPEQMQQIRIDASEGVIDFYCFSYLESYYNIRPPQIGDEVIVSNGYYIVTEIITSPAAYTFVDFYDVFGSLTLKRQNMGYLPGTNDRAYPLWGEDYCDATQASQLTTGWYRYTDRLGTSWCSIPTIAAPVSKGAPITEGHSVLETGTPPPADTTPPVLSNGRPSGIISSSSTIVSVNTNEVATCKYGTTAGTNYDSMESGVSTRGTFHSKRFFGLSDGVKTYYVRCKDSAGNINTNDYVISFTVSSTAPKGWLESADCDTITGWTCDPDNYTLPIYTHIYADGSALNQYKGAAYANISRGSAVEVRCNGNPNHGFSFTVPDSLKDGNPHTIYAYAININSAGSLEGANPLLPFAGLQQTIICDVPLGITPLSADKNALSLAKGFNLISSPIAEGVSLSTLEKNCKFEKDGSDFIFELSPGGKWIELSANKILPFKGYVVKAAAACTVPVNGTPAVLSEITVKPGYALISANGDFNNLLGTCENKLKSGMNGSKIFELTPDGQWNPVNSLNIGKGYLIKAKEQCALKEQTGWLEGLLAFVGF